MAKKGEKLSVETRQKISESQIARFKRRLEEEDTAAPSHKRCTKCGELKSVVDFYLVKRKLKSGLVSVWPQTPCKSCRGKQEKVRRQQLKAEGVDLQARKRQAEANEDREKRLQRRREWAAIRRREEGKAVRGPYKETSPRSRYLNALPLVAFLRSLPSGVLHDLKACSDSMERKVNSLFANEHNHLELRTADKILLALGCPEQMNILYPLEEEKLVGYQILDPDGILND